MGKSLSEALPLEARGIVVEAVGQRLLDGVNLELCTGPRSVIIGPNGAGKSLLLRVLHGLTQPNAGEVRSGGRRFDRSSLRKQGMVFQQPVLLRRNAAANLRFHSCD